MRLIDADKLKDFAQNVILDNSELLTSSVVLKAVLLMIDKAPTIDAEPVRHGKWIKHEKGYWRARKDKESTQWIIFLLSPEKLTENADWIEWAPDYECSECGSRGWSYAIGCTIENMHCCPHCGALMDGEG